MWVRISDGGLGLELEVQISDGDLGLELGVRINDGGLGLGVQINDGFMVRVRIVL